MNTSQFDKYFSEAALGGIWSGAQPANYIFQFSFQGPKFIVLNTDESDGPGLHRVAVYLPDSGPLEFFDSLGKSPETYHGYFKDWIVSSGRGYMRNEWRYQDYGTSTCGEFCIYYGVKRLRGETMRQILLTLDPRNLYYNDIIVSDFVRNLL